MAEIKTRQQGNASVHDDEDAFVLEIDLMDNRSVVLTYPKPNGCYGEEAPSVTIWTGSGEHDFGDETLEMFEDWAKVAIGAMDRKRERLYFCQICDDQQGFGPMPRDEVWDAIAPNPRGMMCLDCMQIRATACLRRKLKNADLRADCPYNSGKEFDEVESV